MAGSTRNAFIAVAAATLASCAPTAAQERVVVDVALVLAVDVSGSMDYQELQIQRDGYVAALRDPDLLRIVAASPRRRIALSHFEWAGFARTESLLPWVVVEDAASLARFADALEAAPIRTSRGTSLSRAIEFGLSLVAAAEFDADRWVIDLSGDGPNNVGPPAPDARDRAMAAGVTINGLPLILRPSQGAVDLERYFEDCVVGGPGAFVMPATSAEEIAPAIKRKLFRELIGRMEGDDARVVLASDHEPIDCMIGEKLREQREQRF